MRERIVLLCCTTLKHLSVIERHWRSSIASGSNFPSRHWVLYELPGQQSRCSRLLSRSMSDGCSNARAVVLGP